MISPANPRSGVLSALLWSSIVAPASFLLFLAAFQPWILSWMPPPVSRALLFALALVAIAATLVTCVILIRVGHVAAMTVGVIGNLCIWLSLLGVAGMGGVELIVVSSLAFEAVVVPAAGILEWTLRGRL